MARENEPTKDGKQMPLDTPPGAKVRFTGRGGYEFDQSQARQHLQVGELYTVSIVETGSEISFVRLEEFPGIRFNTVMFEVPKKPGLLRRLFGGGKSS